MLGLIYIIKNIKNDKVYIGQTTCGLNYRWNQHLKSAMNNYEPTMVIYNAMRKYGIENFFISILEDNIEIEKLNEREKYWIDYYNSKVPNGYNVREGGEDCGRKEVYKIDIKTNNIIECYGSATAAAVANNLDLSGLTKACRKEASNCGGFKWSYKENYDRDYIKNIKIKPFKQEIYQIEPSSKEIINKFDSISEASQKTGINASCISAALSGRYFTSGGFGWCYTDKYEEYEPRLSTKQVIQMDKNENIIKIWNSAKDAAEYIGGNSNTIRSSCRGVRKTAYGFKWKYKN